MVDVAPATGTKPATTEESAPGIKVGTKRVPVHIGSDGTERPLRVLHIGNIANNAYKNAKLLNEAGLNCDVLCYDYYHIMGSPEWEDADIDGVITDQFYPNWSSVNLNGFRRPRWFTQGPLESCARYLVARCRGQVWRARVYRSILELRRWWLCAVRKPLSRKPWLRWVHGVRRMAARLKEVARIWLRSIPWLRRLVRTARSRLKGQAAFGETLLPHERGDEFSTHARYLVEEFRRRFPDRSDHLTLEEIETWRPQYATWKKLLHEYDIVQGYATDPFLPLVCGKHPYVGFEHGTLRDIPFEPTAQGRITAIGYALADGVFITNGDCLASASRLNLRAISPMVHPVDERDYAAIEAKSENCRQQFGVRYVFLCTLRHDWAVKGTDVYLRALPGLVQRLGRDFRLLLTTWGTEVDASKRLIAELNVDELVVWLDPIPRRRLIELQKAVDVVFDQIALPHFGATAPEALAAGVPVLMSYDPRSTEWIVSEPAPILTVHTPEDVVQQTLLALDPEWRHDFGARAQRWITQQHSYRRVVEGHLEMYRQCLEQIAIAEQRTMKG